MLPSSDSFCNELTVYEKRLRDNPASYCFAHLAELYLEAGRMDDALSAARAGVARYPGFVAGQMALARVCQQQGLVDEALHALAVVTTAVPESLEAQRMRIKLCRALGRHDEALQALQTVLEFYPDDQELRAELPELEKGLLDNVAVGDDDLELIELREEDMISDLPEEALEDELVLRTVFPAVQKTDPFDNAAVSVFESDTDAGEAAFDAEPQAADDPLITATVAELYRSQGFIDKARDIYRALLARNPADAAAAAGLASLEQQSTETAATAVVTQDAAAACGSAGHGAVAILEGWLENIRRLQVCR